MSETYLLSTVPFPKDVINLPMSLFINSVLNHEAVIQHISQENYLSYIAVFAKETYRNLNTLTIADKKRIKNSALELSSVLKSRSIFLSPEAQDLFFCCLHLDEIIMDTFLVSYNIFCKTVGV